MSTPETPEQPPQDSNQGGSNSNLPDPNAPPLTAEQYPDPATHADDPSVRDKAGSSSSTPPPVTNPPSNPSTTGTTS